MEVVELSLPAEIGHLLENDKKLMIRSTRHMIKERLWELNNSLEESQEKIEEFKKKYSTDFHSFEKKIKNAEFTEHIHHEDYNEWFFWENVCKRVQKIIKDYEK